MCSLQVVDVAPLLGKFKVICSIDIAREIARCCFNSVIDCWVATVVFSTSLVPMTPHCWSLVPIAFGGVGSCFGSRPAFAQVVVGMPCFECGCWVTGGNQYGNEVVWAQIDVDWVSFVTRVVGPTDLSVNIYANTMAP